MAALLLGNFFFSFFFWFRNVCFVFSFFKECVVIFFLRFLVQSKGDFQYRIDTVNSKEHCGLEMCIHLQLKK